MLKIVEWGGSLMGLIGAALLATNSAWSGFGFVAFLFSNFCWAFYAIKVNSRALLLMQCGFTLTSVLGIYRWLM